MCLKDGKLHIVCQQKGFAKPVPGSTGAYE